MWTEEKLKEPWCKSFLSTMCNPQVIGIDGVDMPPIGNDEIIKDITSDEWIDKMIKDELGE